VEVVLSNKKKKYLLIRREKEMDKI